MNSKLRWRKDYLSCWDSFSHKMERAFIWSPCFLKLSSYFLFWHWDVHWFGNFWINSLLVIMSRVDEWLQDALECKPITESSVRALCNMVKNVLIDESNIVVVDAPVKIAGDVHGQFYDVKEMFKQGGGIPDNKFIMIGDFVDRGYNSVETITLLFCLKVKYPDRIFLLRGNHECRNITMMYGFLDEINRKYGNSNCWKYFYEAFDFLPLGAVVNGRILCVHGGMSPDLPTIDQMRLLDRKQEIPHEGPLADLMWSDPDNIESWRRNTRGAGWIFGHKVVEQFNRLNNV